LGREGGDGAGEGATGTGRLRIWVGEGAVVELGKEAGGGVGEGVGKGPAAELGIGRRLQRIWSGKGVGVDSGRGRSRAAKVAAESGRGVRVWSDYGFG